MQIKNEDRVLVSPEYYNYPCQSEEHDHSYYGENPGDFTLDKYFPNGDESSQLNLNSEICLHCQGVELV